MADQNLPHENDHKLDEMLDAMLSAYSSVEPRPGLETRILAQVRAQSEKQDRGWSFRWLLAAAAVASAAIILIVIHMSRPEPLPAASQLAHSPQKHETPAAAQQQKSPKLFAAAGSKTAIQRNGNRAARVMQASSTKAAVTEVAVVRQDVFPSRSPLSEQEKLLLRYLAHTPREELIAQSRPDPPDESDDDGPEPRPQNLTQVPQRNNNTR